jgi:SAM-dependent methyltransferase
MSAADRWARDLERWAIPQELLDAVDESPYGWPQSLWKRRSAMAEQAEEPRTAEVVASMLDDGDSLIDVGAGRGRASLRFAEAGHPLVAVEKDPGMAGGLREDAKAMGVQVTVVEERWPDAENLVPTVAVVMSAHVVYDVADIGAFVAAMHRKASTGVVMELSPHHPWASLAPYYRAIHGLDRPDGPTADDLAQVVAEETGVPPHSERWRRSGQLWFESWDEILELFGRRLVVPVDRRSELRSVLEPDVVEVDGRLYVGDPGREVVTVWWSKAG